MEDMNNGRFFLLVFDLSARRDDHCMADLALYLQPVALSAWGPLSLRPERHGGRSRLADPDFLLARPSGHRVAVGGRPCCRELRQRARPEVGRLSGTALPQSQQIKGGRE